jgi:hypothetical protein
MNDTNPISGFHPRLMGGLCGLMLLSGIFSLFPAEPAKTSVPARAETIGIPFSPRADAPAVESSRHIVYKDKDGEVRVLSLGLILHPVPGKDAFDLERDLPETLETIASQDRIDDATIRALHTFERAFAFEARTGGPQAQARKKAASRFRAILAGLDVCAPDYLTGQKKCPI